MKRYENIGYGMYVVEQADGDMVMYEEAAAVIADRDAEIADKDKAINELHDSLIATDKSAIRLIEELRTSNEALVAALHKNKQHLEIVANVCEGWTIPGPVRKSLETMLYAEVDNLTALAEHDKEVRAKALEDAVDTLRLLRVCKHDQRLSMPGDGYYREAISAVSKLREEG